MALIRDDQLLLRQVRGDATARPRALHPPGHTLLVSPDVPEDMREALLRDPNEGQPSEAVAFLYMDEKYPDTNAPPLMQVTSLTGLLISSDKFPRFRDELLKIVPGFEEGAKNFNVQIHASNLFPHRSDEDHFQFYSGPVSLVNDFGFSVYRRGVNFIPDHPLLRKKQKYLLGLCFRSMLISADEYAYYAQIWPVMETDGSKDQDRNFVGYVRWMDEAIAYLQTCGDGVEQLIGDDYMVDNSRVGELRYVTKKSIAGVAVDCLSY